MSLINFLNHCLNPKVTYNCVSDDLYKPENLISSSQELLNMGFMAYNVVKPPIDLIFNFCNKVDIHLIKLWLKYNLNVKTTGVELYTNINNQNIRVGEFNSYFQIKNNSLNLSCEGCLFYRSDLYPNYNGIADNMKQIKFEKTYSLRSTNNIKIVLKNTNRGCAPVLKKIEVWGLPSRECSSQEMFNLNKLWNKVNIINPNMYNSSIETPTTPTYVKLEEKFESTVNSKIPEEFLDSITYEVMTLPMVLPSGKIVDKITVDRHTEIEMTNGRCSSDPFTGLPFTSERKPIYDHALKLQIDEFLIKHQNDYEIKIMPRAIGKKRIRNDNEYDSKRATNQISINTLNVPSLSTVDLDFLVSDAVKNIKKAKTTVNKKTNEFCSDCDKYSSELTMYKIINCNHSICRSCLMSNKNPVKICKLCLEEYKNCDLIKVNL